MKIPRYWVRGSAEAIDPVTKETHRTTACGWSDASPSEAARDAVSRAERIITWLCNGCETDVKDYDYAMERPLREPIVRELGGAAQRIAAITRNSYGALVLNTAQVMFIDVDEDTTTPIGAFVGKLFGKKKPDPFATLKRAVEETPSLGVRIYRTAGGWRCLVTSQIAEPTDPSADDLMSRCGADTRYRILCRQQESFRARLTPKPYRCKIPNPPCTYPFIDAAAEKRFAEWLKKYESASANFGVCELVDKIGPSVVDPAVATVMKAHDDATMNGKPLA